MHTRRCNKNLKDAYADLSLNEIQDIGTELGKWLANLHGTTPRSHVTEVDGRKNLIGVAIAGFTYTHLAETLKEDEDYGKLGNRINKLFGDLIVTDNEPVCHGDSGPGNTMLQSDTPSKVPTS